MDCNSALSVAQCADLSRVLAYRGIDAGIRRGDRDASFAYADAGGKRMAAVRRAALDDDPRHRVVSPPAVLGCRAANCCDAVRAASACGDIVQQPRAVAVRTGARSVVAERPRKWMGFQSVRVAVHVRLRDAGTVASGACRVPCVARGPMADMERHRHRARLHVLEAHAAGSANAGRDETEPRTAADRQLGSAGMAGCGCGATRLVARGGAPDAGHRQCGAAGHAMLRRRRRRIDRH
ncbi:hypothetical protein DFQ28_009312 [Apophysomyces sp. BC1034]|nr:hypothetical protein DFQ28_009312 [Apophysomyces sp. BC1034]